MVTNSGLTADEYPLTHAVLYTEAKIVVTLASMVIFVAFILGLEPSKTKEQFKSFGFAIICAEIISETSASLTSLYFYGIYWAIFVPLVVAFNDAFAYLVGITFGRNKLIGLSPKKTVEGFIGGAIFTLIFTYYSVCHLYRFERLTCRAEYITFRPFEPIECRQNPVFDTVELGGGSLVSRA